MTEQSSRLDPEWWAVQNTPNYNVDNLSDQFREAMNAAVDEYIRKLDEQAYQGDAHNASSQNPEAQSEMPDRKPIAQSMVINFMDGSQQVVHMHNPIMAGGWTFRQLNGIPYLVIGHGIPRQQLPLCNIKSIDLLENLV